jgi:hypothetical protein
VQRLQQRFSNSQSVGIAYLFIDSKDRERNTLSNLLGSIRRQLLLFPPDDGLMASYEAVA